MAASGWTSADGNSNDVYIFLRQTGTLVKAIPGHSRLIFNLAWSPDGRFLAATLRGGALHVYRAGTFDQVGTTPNHDCKKGSYGADFDAPGRLVVSCDDGLVRLYRSKRPGYGSWRSAHRPAGRSPSRSVSHRTGAVSPWALMTPPRWRCWMARRSSR